MVVVDGLPHKTGCTQLTLKCTERPFPGIRHARTGMHGRRRDAGWGGDGLTSEREKDGEGYSIRALEHDGRVGSGYGLVDK